ncbi:hypothetical protein NITHO_4920020 [Nitrolancea hollandica Lb]|uniref:Uncharacterized protein n=1 Tax=Nitrolancea hollandica Lb TaxID=1129897 RepID=I4EL47_9BACT|nr:hypothetical protein NITHO_4920020 [Nitrolancea hollandica Lb]
MAADSSTGRWTLVLDTTTAPAGMFAVKVTTPDGQSRWIEPDIGMMVKHLVGPNGEAPISDNSISTAKIIDAAVVEVKIAPGAVTTTKLADASVTQVKIADNAVSTSQLANDAVTGDKIADAAVDTLHIKDGAITQEKLAAGVGGGSGTVGDGTVTNSKLAANAVTSDKIADGAVATVDLADSAVTKAKLAEDAKIRAQEVRLTADKNISTSATDIIQVVLGKAGTYFVHATCDFDARDANDKGAAFIGQVWGPNGKFVGECVFLAASDFYSVSCGRATVGNFWVYDAANDGETLTLKVFKVGGSGSSSRVLRDHTKLGWLKVQYRG